MFSSLARLRVLPLSLLLLLFPQLSSSREEQLFTSSVTYCEPPETLLIQKFQVAYFPNNHSVSFNISAASVEPNVNVSANLYLNVYGMNPVNVTLDLCNILHGALCPLPMYNFTGSDSIPLPPSISVANQIPAIAYKMPDIEAFAQLTLIQVGTGDVKACVQSTLSNGWSAHQYAVEWVTGGIALFAFLSAFWQSVWPDALAPFRLIELFYLYQTIVSSNFLSINYPSVYRSYGLNFAWAMGLFSSASSSIQRAVTNMRHLTGGHLDDTSSDTAVGFVNRKLSPYNFPGKSTAVIFSRSYPASGQSLPTDFSSFSSLFANNSSPFDGLKQLSASTDVQTVTSASSNVLQAGLPIYVNSVHIATANAFTTVFLVALILLAIAVAIIIIGGMTLVISTRLKVSTRANRQQMNDAFPCFVKAWLLRITAIVFSPIFILAFYQWTLKDSWLSALLAVVAFSAVFGCIAFASFIIIRFALTSGPPALFSHRAFFPIYGPLFAQYRMERFQFYLAIFITFFLKAVVIAAAKGHGQTQVILWIVIEAFLVVANLALQPHKIKGGNILSTYLAITRLVCAGLMIAFVEGLAVKAIPRVVIGVIIAVLWSVAVVVMVVSIILNAGIERLWRKRGTSLPSTSVSSEISSVLEKGNVGSVILSASSSAVLVSRPVNPTPEQNMPLDPQIIQPYLYSPTITTITDDYQRPREPSSAGSSTLGSVLPRRWSITPSSPPISTPHSAGSAFTLSQASSSPHTSLSPYPNLHSTPEQGL